MTEEQLREIEAYAKGGTALVRLGAVIELAAEVRRLGKAVVAQRTALEEARDHLYRWQAATAPDDEIEHGSNAITTVCAALGVEP